MASKVISIQRAKVISGRNDFLIAYLQGWFATKSHQLLISHSFVSKQKNCIWVKGARPKFGCNQVVHNFKTYLNCQKLKDEGTMKLSKKKKSGHKRNSATERT